MKTICIAIAACVLVCHAQEPEKYIFTKEKQTVIEPVPGKNTSMEVIDRTADGCLVQTYTVEKQYLQYAPFVRDVRSNGEIVFVAGLANGVGVLVGESKIYFTGEDYTLKGTAYRKYSINSRDGAKISEQEVTVKTPNPEWIEWAKTETAKKQQAAKQRIVDYQHQQASNGFPSFQLEMAKRYLRGDGVETNLALARHWLQAACTNGEPVATNLLSQLK
jgi:hypothetical protein